MQKTLEKMVDPLVHEVAVFMPSCLAGSQQL